MIGQLKSIGIEKGQPFSPDAATQDILHAAASEAHAWLELNGEVLNDAWDVATQYLPLNSPAFDGVTLPPLCRSE